MKLRRGSVAICGVGTLGLVTSDEPIEVTYPDGKTGKAWVGVHLTDKIAPIGSPWSSRHPETVAHVDDFVDWVRRTRLNEAGLNHAGL